MNADAASGAVDIFGLFLLGVFGLLILSGFVLQLLAFRHRREEYGLFGHKDSMFRHKENAYTEEGMKYIRLQKMVIIAACIAALFAALRYMPS